MTDIPPIRAPITGSFPTAATYSAGGITLTYSTDVSAPGAYGLDKSTTVVTDDFGAVLAAATFPWPGNPVPIPRQAWTCGIYDNFHLDVRNGTGGSVGWLQNLANWRTVPNGRTPNLATNKYDDPLIDPSTVRLTFSDDISTETDLMHTDDLLFSWISNGTLYSVNTNPITT